MKKRQGLVTFILVSLLILSCGGDQQADADQVGIALQGQTAQHGHSGPTDGGTLNSPFFSVSVSGSKVVSSGTSTKVRLDVKVFDTNNTFDLINNRHVPTSSGKYLYNGSVCVVSNTTMNYISVSVYKNGAAQLPEVDLAGTWTTATNCIPVSTVLDMNGTTDRAELWVQLFGTGTLTVTNGFMNGIRVSR